MATARPFSIGLIFPVQAFLIVLLLAATTTARPVSVVLYPSDAKITEAISVTPTMEGDAASAKFFLPIHALKDSLTVTVHPEDNFLITSVSVRPETLPAADNVKTLKEKLKNLNRKKNETENRIKANTACAAFWQRQADGIPEKLEAAESIEKLGEAIKKGMIAASDELIGLNVSLEDIAEQIRLVQEALDKLTGSARQRWAVTAYLTGKAAGVASTPVRLILSYPIANCGWRPIYTLNAHPASASVSFTWAADIIQDTGVDWEDVNLKLATARAVTQPEPPELRDWVIQPKEPILRQESPMSKAALPFAAAPQAMENDMAGALPAPERKAGYAFDTYDMGNRTLPTGESRHIALRELTLKADFKHLVRPQETPQAFLFAVLDIKDDAFVQLPEGEAAYLIDSAFVGARPFSMTDKNQKLFFGADPQVSVKMDLLTRKSGEKGLISDKKTWEWGWKATLENLSPHAIAVVMEDAYPHVRDKRIILEETFGGPNPKKEDNRLTWSFPVAAKTKTTVEYGFSITYPEDMALDLGGR